MEKKNKYALSPQKQAAVDRAVNECAGKAAVEKMLKSSLNPKYAVYQFFGLSDGNVCMVNIGEEITVHLLPADSATVKNWRRKRTAAMKAAEAKAEGKIAKLGKAAAKRKAK